MGGVGYEPPSIPAGVVGVGADDVVPPGFRPPGYGPAGPGLPGTFESDVWVDGWGGVGDV